MKFTPEEGSICVRASVLGEDARQICVGVADTGCGLNPDQSKRIFDYLYQAEAPFHITRRGLGLGLYICKELITRHGGKIWVDTEPGQGSTFFFTLPVFSIASLVKPILAADKLHGRRVALFQIDVFPAEQHRQINEADDNLLREISSVIRACILPADVLLPRASGVGNREHFFVVACPNEAGAELIQRRVETQLSQCDNLRHSDLAVSVGHVFVDDPRDADGSADERSAALLAERIEKSIHQATTAKWG